MFPRLPGVLLLLGAVLLTPRPGAAQEFTISTVAGKLELGDNGPAVHAELNRPQSVAVDREGNVYIADYVNHLVRRVDPSGTITTIAGTGRPGFSEDGVPAVQTPLDNPRSVAVDSAGNVYIADHSARVLRVDPSGTITTVAGTGQFRGGETFSGDGGPALQADLNPFSAVAVDGAGNIYIVESAYNRIYRVDPSGTITTIAGNGLWGFSGDGGPALQAGLNDPVAVAVDREGNVYIADYRDHRIRKIDSSGTIATFAGTGVPGFSGDGGPAVQAELNRPWGVEVDGTGNVYIVDSYNHRIRRVDPSGTITTIAGTGQNSFSGDGGPAVQAGLASPTGAAVDREGNVYIADRSNRRVRRIDPSGTITTIAGTGQPGFNEDFSGDFSGDGGPAVQAELNSPTGVAVDGAGNVYFADARNHRIRMIDPSGTIGTFAGTGQYGFSEDGGPAVQTHLNAPIDVAVDGVGNVYFADARNHRIRMIDPSGTIGTFAGTGQYGLSGDGGPAAQAELHLPQSVAVDGAGNVYIADTRNNRIRRVDPSGTIITIAGTGQPGFNENFSEGFSGDGGPAVQAQLDGPTGVAVDEAGNVYIADYGNHRIRRVDPAGTITTIAGTGQPGFNRNFRGDPSPAVQVQLNYPRGVAVDGAGNIYIADTVNHLVRRVDSSGTITTVAGNETPSGIAFHYTGLPRVIPGLSGDGGPAVQAQLDFPRGVAVDGAGNVYIADTRNNRIRRVDPSGTIATVAGINDLEEFRGVLEYPTGIAVDAAENVYIADSGNRSVRRVDPSGTIVTFAGNGQYPSIAGAIGDGSPAFRAQFAYPSGVAVDGAGNVYIAEREGNRIRRVDPSGIIATFAGTGQDGFAGDGGPAIQAWLNRPKGVAVDGAGNVYFVDARNHRIRKVDSMGTITTFAGTGQYPSIPVFSGDGGPAVQAELSSPWGVAVDGASNVYFADSGNNNIRRVDSSGTITTIAGTGEYGFAGDGGMAVEALLTNPYGVAVDDAGNVYIADRGNHRIRMVASSGTIKTIAGTGVAGFSGDGGSAVQAQLQWPTGVAVDGAGNVYITDTGNHRIRLLTPTGPASTQPFLITDRGGVSFSSQGASSTSVSGYGHVEADDGMTSPDGLAIFGYRQNGILVSEAGVPAVPAVLEGRIFAETDGAVRTGLAIANPNDGPATVRFFFTDGNGMDYGHGSLMLGPREQTARFLDEDPFNGGSGMLGTFTFTSNQPVAVIALRGFVNERSEFLMTTLPVAPLSAPAGGTVYFPHFTDGGGWTTQVILVNPTDALISGSVQFRSQGSATTAAGAATLTLADGRTGSEFTYSIPPRSATRLETANPAGSTQQSGSVRMVAGAGASVPSGVSVFAYERGGVTVSEAGVPASDPGAAFRMYVETSGAPGQPGAARTGIALTNTSGTAAAVTLELTALDGTSTGPAASLPIPASGQVARFIDEIFPGLRTPFSGILRITSKPPSPFHTRADLAVIGLRLTTNERRDVVVTTTPPLDEDSPTTASELFFPHFVDSGGWTTQFILYSGTPGGTPSGSLLFTGQDGQPLELSVSSTAAQTVP